METLTTNGVLVVHVCPTCSIAYAIPRELHNRRKSDGDSWYCPNGHSVAFTESKEQKLRAELEAAQRQAITARSSRDVAWREQERAHERADTAERSKAAIRGHLTRMRNKVANGVCPVPNCRRHFENVSNHLRIEHEGWLVEHDVLIESE